ncbi:MAG: HIT domain-containing protein [Alphaproteobacteria bacterium]|nr:HIT domain-containing protein [Alphaproteobacteria bacterium]MBQ8686866.1 HIT domain-containing protein [Alphaproteobacteria bacterium]
MYDKNNVFAKIIRGEIPCNRVYENEYAMSFYDVNPMFSTHVLIIPKGDYENILDFAKNASADEQTGFWDCFTKTADILGVECEFNCLANAGANAPFVRQSVFHFHMHLVSGDKTPAFKDMISEIKA